MAKLDPIRTTTSVARVQTAGFAGLLFLSGAAGLIYQVLWMKELGLLFGNTAQAAATTLTTFFLGLAAGGWWFGRVSGRSARPLVLYARLELAVSATALLYFGLPGLYRRIYPSLFDTIGGFPAAFTLCKVLLSLGLLGPAAFCMGGTLPLLVQHVVRNRQKLGTVTPVLYAVNTVGAAVGACAAGFWLPRWFGFAGSYWIAVGMTTAVGIVALVWSGKQADGNKQRQATAGARPPLTESARVVALLAGLSGVVALGLEVLWTRMFAQTLHNSVYTYAAILVVFLIALGAGSITASVLARRFGLSQSTLSLLLTFAGVLVAATPAQFVFLTQNDAYLGGTESWGAYMALVFQTVALALFPATFALGMTFPYLMKMSEPIADSSGRTIGNLVAINTVGAAFGSLVAGFVLLEWFGLWASILLLGGLYLPAALFVARREPWLVRIPSIAGIVFVLIAFFGDRFPVVRISGDKEVLHEVWEGSAATVAVVEHGDDLRIKVNNFYTLGSTRASRHQRLQSDLPLLVHPKPRRVYYLGMGTGITAGAAIAHPEVEEITVTELLPDVIVAARRYFSEHATGLFTDPRATIVAADGRNYLAATTDIYDVIIADLFTPWRAGVGSLYTREHYRNVASRLADDGVFAQWVPMFQVTESEFRVIVRTMLEVFPRVTVWRGDFLGHDSIVGLLGLKSHVPLDVERFHQRALPIGELRGSQISNSYLIYYCGSLTTEVSHVGEGPISTDDYPLLEYEAPVNHRREKAGEVARFSGRPLVDWLETVTGDPAGDSWLQHSNAAHHLIVQAGTAYHRFKAAEKAGDEKTRTAAYDRYLALMQALMR